MAKGAGWASRQVPNAHAIWVHGTVRREMGHWSRPFEYWWVLNNSDFCFEATVLDAAGGDTPLQYYMATAAKMVVNLDLDPDSQARAKERYGHWPEAQKVRHEVGDIQRLPYSDATFDKVVCVSVMEHMEKPEEAIKELWRVLKPGGRLLVTLDVASYARHNHTIDMLGAQGLLALFGMDLPEYPNEMLVGNADEENPGPDEPKVVELKVLCFFCDK